MRHNAVNDLIKRALASADVTSMLEPNSLSREDAKLPDGVTVLPWTNGRCMVWDLTCPDTLAASYLNRAVLSPSSVTNDAESRKLLKYGGLASIVVPVAVEALETPGEEASGRLLSSATLVTISLQ